MSRPTSIKTALRNFGLTQLDEAVKHLEGLRAREVLLNERDELMEKLEKLNRELGGSEVRSEPHMNGAVGRKESVKKVGRFRPTTEEVAKAAKEMGKLFRGGKEVARKDIVGAVGEQWRAHITKLIAAHNEAHPTSKIATNGKVKALSRYVIR